MLNNVPPGILQAMQQGQPGQGPGPGPGMAIPQQMAGPQMGPSGPPQGGQPDQMSALMQWIMQLMQEGKPLPPMLTQMLGLQTNASAGNPGGGMPDSTSNQKFTSYQR